MHKQAQKKLARLPEKQRILISEAIRFLGLDPDDKRLDIKKLAGVQSTEFVLVPGELFMIEMTI